MPTHPSLYRLQQCVYASAEHVLARHRESDLVAVVEAHPGLLGLGIDESTAVVVHGKELEVIGKSKVAVYDGKEHEGRQYYFLELDRSLTWRKARRNKATARRSK